jgi:hypothetical protein
VSIIDATITAHSAAAIGQDIFLRRMNRGTNVFVAYFEPGRLIALSHGTIIHFLYKPSVRVRWGSKLINMPCLHPLAKVHIEPSLEMFLDFEHKDELVAVNDIVRDTVARVVALPLPPIVPDIVNDIDVQLVRHGVIPGIEAQLLKDGLVEV